MAGLGMGLPNAKEGDHPKLMMVFLMLAKRPGSGPIMSCRESMSKMRGNGEDGDEMEERAAVWMVQTRRFGLRGPGQDLGRCREGPL